MERWIFLCDSELLYQVKYNYFHIYQLVPKHY